MHETLANLTDQQDHVIACQEAIDIVEGLEVIEVKVEDTQGS